MNLIELLLTVTHELEEQDVVYALTGSIASSIYGQPQPSLDADLVLRMTPTQATAVAQALKTELYVAEAALTEAAERHAMANIIDGASGLKIDLSVLAASPFHDELLRRRRRVSAPGEPEKAIWLCSPEDILLMKMEWRKDTRSDKQLRDARNVVQGQRQQLDWNYISHWAEQLGVAADVQALRDELD